MTSQLDETVLQVHREVGAIFRANPEDAVRASREARDRLGALPPFDPEIPASWEACEIITGDLRILLGFLGETVLVSSQPAGFRTLVVTILRYLNQSDRGNLGILLAEEIDRRWTIELGRDHMDRLAACDQLAACMFARGQIQAALPLFEEALELYSQIEGQEHPATLNAEVNLCACLAGGGNGDLALPLIEHALYACARVFGWDADITLRAASVFADTIFGLDDTRTALDFYRDVHFRYLRSKGKDHLATLNAAENVAIVLNKVGDYEAARALNEDTLRRYKRLLEAKKDEKTYTEEDQRIANSRKRLIANLEALGCHEEADKVHGGRPNFDGAIPQGR